MPLKKPLNDRNPMAVWAQLEATGTSVVHAYARVVFVDTPLQIEQHLLTDEVNVYAFMTGQ
jgi:hypothetical protein